MASSAANCERPSLAHALNKAMVLALLLAPLNKSNSVRSARIFSLRGLSGSCASMSAGPGLTNSPCRTTTCRFEAILRMAFSIRPGVSDPAFGCTTARASSDRLLRHKTKAKRGLAEAQISGLHQLINGVNILGSHAEARAQRRIQIAVRAGIIGCARRGLSWRRVRSCRTRGGLDRVELTQNRESEGTFEVVAAAHPTIEDDFIYKWRRQADEQAGERAHQCQFRLVGFSRLCRAERRD